MSIMRDLTNPIAKWKHENIYTSWAILAKRTGISIPTLLRLSNYSTERLGNIRASTLKKLEKEGIKC